MKHLGRVLALSWLVLASLPLRSADLLEEDWTEILDQAGSQGRHLYVAFLGDGWSLSCKRFSETILESDAFQTLANERLLVCTAKAKREKELSKKAAARLQSLVIHFDIKSYPTILLIAPDGREILRHGFLEKTGAEYVELLEAVLPEASPVEDEISPGSA